MRLLRILAICALLTFGLAPPASATAMFTGLGDLPGGVTRSIGIGVSADGSTAVGSSESQLSSPSNQAIRWTEAGGIQDLGSGFSQAWGVSGDGSIVVGIGDTGAIIWTEATGPLPLPGLAGSTGSTVYDISTTGSVAVGSIRGSDEITRAVRWIGGEAFSLGLLPDGSVAENAKAVSGDGAVIVGNSGNPTPWGPGQAFRWTEGQGAVGLGILDGGERFGSRALGVSADGLIVVGESDSTAGLQGFVWTEGDSMVGLGFLSNHDDSAARDISADGSVIVGEGRCKNGFCPEEAVFWITGGIYSLQDILVEEFGLGRELAGWQLGAALGISDDGLTIVGAGTNPDGFVEGWLVQLDRSLTTIPEPSTALLLATGLAGLAAARRWRL